MNPVVVVTLVFALVLPLGLLIWWKKKTKASLWCFIVGTVCFFVFSAVLESLVNQFFLTGNHALSAKITGSPILYMLFGSFAAGIFEETGRLFGFRVLLRKHSEKECAVAYGIGHGGIEVLLVLGATYFVYLLALFGVNIGTPQTTALTVLMAKAITINSALFAMAERISAMMMHIGLSMIIFVAARKKEKRWLYPVCICIHALSDMPACLYQFGVLKSLPVIEIIAFIMGLACLFIGKRLLYGGADGTDDELEETV